MGFHSVGMDRFAVAVAVAGTADVVVAVAVAVDATGAVAAAVAVAVEIVALDALHDSDRALDRDSRLGQTALTFFVSCQKMIRNGLKSFALLEW
jgi:hypothetical protein